MNKWKRLLVAIAAAAYALMWNLAQVTPADAKRNLKAWAPDWVASRWALATVLGASALTYMWWFRADLLRSWRLITEIRIRSPFYLRTTTTPDIATLNHLREENQQYRTELRGYRWERNWNSSPPGVQPLSAEDAEKAATELARLDFVLKTLDTTISHLWDSVSENWRRGGSDRPEFWCGKYVYDSVFAPARRSLALLRNPGDEDRREAFKVFFENYKALREWFVRAALLQSIPVTSYRGYSAWYAADQALFSKLNDLPNVPYMAEVRMIVSYARDASYPASLPQPEAGSAEGGVPTSNLVPVIHPMAFTDAIGQPQQPGFARVHKCSNEACRFGILIPPLPNGVSDHASPYSAVTCPKCGNTDSVSNA
jgi:hypothetical protein